jgi:predicted ATPase
LGGNLVSILQKLANESEYSSVNDHLNEAMQTVFPDFVKLDISIRASGMGALGYRSRDLRRTVSTVSMSDGQLRFLGLTLLLLLPNPPPLIAIDEPEVGMHPEMLEVFADLLKQASARTQLIISTHSSRLLDFIAPENIITVERKQGETTLERLDYERLQGWLDRYTLGKLWTMGKLEPR